MPYIDCPYIFWNNEEGKEPYFSLAEISFFPRDSQLAGQ
jgi:hypothetical protein